MTSLCDAEPKKGNFLTEEQAVSRSKSISNLSVDVRLDLSNPKEYFVSASLRFVGAGGGILLDYSGAEILLCSVNDLDAIAGGHVQYLNNKVTISPDAFSELESEIVLHFTCRNLYNSDGNGLHQFIDPEDSNRYIFTDLEPFEAHRIFPMFDQPDIKGRLTLECLAPAQWTIVLSNSPLAADPVQSGETKLWTFKTTPPLSPYLWCVVGGFYEMFEDCFDGRIPLRWLCRQSLTKYLKPDVQELFTITKQGIEFYEAFFDEKFPFAKYDQVFLPEYNWGAMENPGLITFSENYIFKDPATILRRAKRADTILHEMAHMWFGDKVTMVWWDALWLNESFATYMASLAVATATSYGDLGWQSFFAVMKEWAMREDQLPTTHAIHSRVADTNATWLNFDGISYGKGASMLKQLVAYVGLDGFRAGLRSYVKTYAWKNTTLEDFIGCIEAAIGFSLKDWTNDWIMTAGMNTLQGKWALEENPDGTSTVTSCSILQTAPEDHLTLRKHCMQVAIVQENGVVVGPFDIVVDAIEETECPDIVGAKLESGQTAALFINYNDATFAKTRLDCRSREFVSRHLSPTVFPKGLNRQQLWRSVYDSVRDAVLPENGGMSAVSFAEMVRRLVALEADASVVQPLLRTVQASMNFVPLSMFQQEMHKMFEFNLSVLGMTTDPELRTTWGQVLMGCAHTPADVKLLQGLVLGVGAPCDPVFGEDSSMRWSVVIKSAAFGLDNYQELLEAELVRDKSDAGLRHAETARSAVPDLDVKEAVWTRMMTDKTSSLHTMRAMCAGFNPRNQAELLLPFADRFFRDIPQVFADRDKELSTAIFHYFLPHGLPDQELVLRLKKLEEEAKGEGPEQRILQRTLKEAVDDAVRVAKARLLCQ